MIKINLKFEIITALLFLCSYVFSQTTLYDVKVGDYTFGSDKYDYSDKAFRYNKNIYVFGYTGSTTINNDITSLYGGGDVVVQIIDSAGNVSQKMFGGGGDDKLINVEQDSIGFWLYIQSYSGTSGSRIKPQNCNTSGGIGTPVYSDLYIVRLNNQLVQINDYSVCLPYRFYAGYYYGSTFIESQIPYIKYVERDKITKKLSISIETVNDSATVYPGNNKNNNYVLKTDSIGLILNVSYLGRASIGSTIKKTLVKTITANDSTCYALMNLSYNNTHNAGNLITINTRTNTYTNLIFKGAVGNTKIKDGFYLNKKLRLYLDNVPNPSSGLNLDSLYLNVYSWIYKINRSVVARTLANKSDTWTILIDWSTPFPTLTQSAIGSNGNTTINRVFNDNNNIYLALSTQGGNSFDKTSNNYGGYDYWVVKMDSLGVIKDQCTFGGTNDDFLFNVNSYNGSMVLSGSSKSGAGYDKSVSSRDGSNYGDSWNILTCESPQINFTPNKLVYDNGELLSISDNSKYVNDYHWYFLDNTGSIDESTLKNPSEYLYNQDTVKIVLFARNFGCYSSGQFSVLVNPLHVGLNELSSDNGSIYPNPFQDLIIIKANNNEINKYKIYDNLGQLVLEGETFNTIITNNIPPGYYTLTIANDKKIHKIKIIKQ